MTVHPENLQPCVFIIYCGCATHCLSKSSMNLLYLCLLHITSEKPFLCEKYPWSSHFRLNICFRLREEFHFEKANLICYFSIKNILSKLAGLILPLWNHWAGSKADYYGLANRKHRLWWCQVHQASWWSFVCVCVCVCCEVFVLGCLNVGVETVWLPSAQRDLFKNLVFFLQIRGSSWCC